MRSHTIPCVTCTTSSILGRGKDSMETSQSKRNLGFVQCFLGRALLAKQDYVVNCINVQNTIARTCMLKCAHRVND